MTDLSRHSMIQRLNKDSISLQEAEDAEQMEYLEKWATEHPREDIAVTCFIICIALAILCAVVNWIRPLDAVAYDGDVCIACHAPDLGTYAKYHKYWRG